MRILVAEDDPGLRDVLVLGLEDAGFQVDAVERGDDAIDQLKFYEYDVAVIDWRMPGAEGVDVVRWARRNDRPTALLMLTARDTPPDRITGLDAGADDYLVKPFDFGELLARIRALQRRPRGVDAPVIVRGLLALDPAKARGRVGRPVRRPHPDRVQHPRGAHAALAGRRRPQVDRRARLAGRDRPAGDQRHRRPAEPPAGQALLVPGADRDRSRDGVPTRGVMSGPGGQDVRRLSIRVALTATALVAVAYLVVAAAVVAIVTQNLTDQVDARLAQALYRAARARGPVPDDFEPGGPHPPGGLPVLSWAITARWDGLSHRPRRTPTSRPSTTRRVTAGHGHRSAASTCGSPEPRPTTSTSSSPRVSTR